MTTPRMVPLATRLDSHDGFSVWVLEMVAAAQIVRTHPLADCGVPVLRERYVAVTEGAK